MGFLSRILGKKEKDTAAEELARKQERALYDKAILDPHSFAKRELVDKYIQLFGEGNVIVHRANGLGYIPTSIEFKQPKVPGYSDIVQLDELGRAKTRVSKADGVGEQTMTYTYLPGGILREATIDAKYGARPDSFEDANLKPLKGKVEISKETGIETIYLGNERDHNRTEDMVFPDGTVKRVYDEAHPERVGLYENGELVKGNGFEAPDRTAARRKIGEVLRQNGGKLTPKSIDGFRRVVAAYRKDHPKGQG